MRGCRWEAGAEDRWLGGQTMTSVPTSTCTPTASNILLNKKERRRNSINRNFVGDYLGLEEAAGHTSVPRQERACGLC